MVLACSDSTDDDANLSVELSDEPASGFALLSRRGLSGAFGALPSKQALLSKIGYLAQGSALAERRLTESDLRGGGDVG